MKKWKKIKLYCSLKSCDNCDFFSKFKYCQIKSRLNCIDPLYWTKEHHPRNKALKEFLGEQ